MRIDLQNFKYVSVINEEIFSNAESLILNLNFGPHTASTHQGRGGWSMTRERQASFAGFSNKIRIGIKVDDDRPQAPKEI